MSFAVIANPNAKVFADDRTQLDALYRLTSGKGLLVTPNTTEELEDDLREMMVDDPETGKERPRFLAIAGGDGTVSQVVTALLRVWDHDHLPDVALLHGGTMNTISKSLGNRGTAVEQLEALIAGTGLKHTRRFSLQVGADRYGFLFGVGIIPRYIERYEAAGDPSPRRAAEVLGRLVLSAFTGGEDAASFFAPTRLDVFVDGKQLPLKEWLLVAAGGVDDVGLRFRPFAGMLLKPNHFGLFASASKPSAFAWDLLSFRLHRRARHSLAFHAWPRELRLVAPEPIRYNLDGELEQAGTTLTVCTGPSLRFVLPPNARPPANALDD